MSWLRVLETSLYDDLRPLRSVLDADGITFLIVEENGQQILLIDSDSDISLAKKRTAQWQQHELPSVTSPKAPTEQAPSFLSVLQAMPVVFLTALLGTLGFLIIYFDFPSLQASLIYQETYLDRGVYRIKPEAGFLSENAWWKILTPAFIHTSIFHLAFNLLWLFEIGSKIERYQSSTKLLVVILLTAIAANVVQYLYEPGTAFGGLSGVVYGLLAYCAVQARMYKVEALRLRKEIEWVLLAWLLICMTGIFSILGIANIANAAHLAGLVSGALLALIPYHQTRTPNSVA